MSELYCDVCDTDASDQCIITRWHDMHVCLDCLEGHEEILREQIMPEELSEA